MRRSCRYFLVLFNCTPGVHVVEDTQDPFRVKIITSRNLGHREAVLEIDVTARELGELMVTVKEGFFQKQKQC